MSISTLSLPVDIPWKRIAISHDMYATDENALPAKWRSSLAVFAYEPVPDPEFSNPEELTTFLKVVVTVTGYQPSGKEIGVGRGINFSSSIIHHFQKLVDQYYPAY